jgi:saccharopine dehydrogenase-like NADP-dependent oxidoreductase
MHTVLVIGGYGFFGARICGALARVPGIHLLIGGRSAGRARALARTLGLEDRQAVCIDVRDQALCQVLRDLRAATVIHTAGPFQGQDYAVACAAIDAGCHYIDLADGREFVGGVGVLDAQARARGVTVVSGASSVPALSSAVAACHAAQFARLDCIQAGISSGARSPGLATVRAVFSYGGKPLRRLQDGVWIAVHGWRGLERHTFPAPLGSRWLGNLDVPDLDLLPRQYPSLRTVSFKGGFASGLGHLVVWALAGLVQAGVISSMVGCAAPLNRLSRWLTPLISARGGMFVLLEGLGHDGRTHRVTWNLIAGHNHGPFIPCGASIALARKLAAGGRLPAGASPCVGLLTLPEYLAALEGLDVREVLE